jgi:hypothetical protein
MAELLGVQRVVGLLIAPLDSSPHEVGCLSPPPLSLPGVTMPKHPGDPLVIVAQRFRDWTSGSEYNIDGVTFNFAI